MWDGGNTGALLVAVVTAAGGVIAAWVTAAAKKWRDRRDASLAERTVHREEWETLLSEWRKEVHELRTMRAEDKRVYDAELRECRARIDQLERDREQDRVRIRALTTDLARLSSWAREVIALLRINDIAFPALPIDIGEGGPE